MEHEIQLKESEVIDDLEINGFKIIQDKSGFCFGIDSVLLSNFAKEMKAGTECVDLGTGTGILSILLCAKTKLLRIIGIEIQEEVADMARRTSILNHLEEQFQVLNIDIKNIISKENKYHNILKRNSFDYVITNPPYKKLNTGKVNENEKRLISRHEITANLEDFIRTANYLLKDKGSLYMVHRPERLVDIISALRNERLEPKEMTFVYPQEDKEPNLVLIKAIKNARPFLKINKPLVVYDKNGNYTQEVLKIYGKDIKWKENYI